MKLDHPRMTAQYIVSNNVTRSRRSGDRDLQWAKKTLRDLDRAMRRLRRLYDFYINEDDSIGVTRRVAKRKKKKPKRIEFQLKYGVEVPNNVDEAIALDKKNKNTFWQDA